MDIFEFISSKKIDKEYLLDCESLESTRASVSGIIGVSFDEIKKFMMGFDLEKSLKISNLLPDYQGHILLKKILELFNSHWGYSHTSWFHYTRSQNLDDYSHGLLSLNDRLEKIWDFLFKISSKSKSEWDVCRKRVENGNETYRIRTSIDSQLGPDGLLIGDERFNRKLGQDHFFQCPEIVRLICRECGCSLEEYSAITTPCVVKFKTKTSVADNLARALTYLYENEQPTPFFTCNQSNCYLGHGKPIPATDIMGVKILNRTET